jgi:hypothetical protein
MERQNLMNQSLARALQANSESDAVEKDQTGSLANGLTGTLKSELHNPVLPSEFDLFEAAYAEKRKWEMANEHSAPFAKAWRGFESCCGGLER